VELDKPILVIPDTQIPFEHKDALKFCTYLKKHHKIPDMNVLCVGDEIDNYNGSAYPKDPDADYSAVNEFEIVRERIREWGDVFPFMKLAVSNHGIRWVRRAIDAQIPTQVLRSYQEIFKMPPGWSWRDEWRFTSLKHPFRMIHGMGYSGVNGHRNAAIDGQISTIIGHLHSHAAVSFIETNGGQRMWAVNTGCLIDVQAYAFKYEKYNRVKPQLGATIIFGSGKSPVFIPL
jgi:hypothetical protein